MVETLQSLISLKPELEHFIQDIINIGNYQYCYIREILKDECEYYRRAKWREQNAHVQLGK